jgi:D-amino peptidase
MTDLEGVAGVVSFENQTYPEDHRTDQARRWLTAELNAAIEGALGAGVEDVLVDDGHGAGGIWFEDLHPAARVLHGGPQVAAWTSGLVFEGVHATCLVGQHAREGVVEGTLHHTQSSRTIDRWTLNGQEIGEIAEWSLVAGAFDVPMIFLSGDRAACREAADLVPGITTAEVKIGFSRQGAISLSRQRACARIREGLAAAIRKQATGPLPPVKWPGPYRVEIRYRTTDLADRAARAGGERVDEKTVARESDNLLDVIYG